MMLNKNDASNKSKQGSRLLHVEMALEALRNVIKNNPGKNIKEWIVTEMTMGALKKVFKISPGDTTKSKQG